MERRGEEAEKRCALHTNVVCLIKDDHCLLCEVIGDHFSNLGVQQVRVVEDHDISLLELRGGKGGREGGREGEGVSLKPLTQEPDGMQ